jgi:hypothetical protein
MFMQRHELSKQKKSGIYNLLTAYKEKIKRLSHKEPKQFSDHLKMFIKMQSKKNLFSGKRKTTFTSRRSNTDNRTQSLARPVL